VTGYAIGDRDGFPSVADPPACPAPNAPFELPLYSPVVAGGYIIGYTSDAFPFPDGVPEDATREDFTARIYDNDLRVIGEFGDLGRPTLFDGPTP
jgi:hypothetical protein